MRFPLDEDKVFHFLYCWRYFVGRGLGQLAFSFKALYLGDVFHRLRRIFCAFVGTMD